MRNREHFMRGSGPRHHDEFSNWSLATFSKTALQPSSTTLKYILCLTWKLSTSKKRINKTAFMTLTGGEDADHRLSENAAYLMIFHINFLLINHNSCKTLYLPLIYGLGFTRAPYFICNGTTRGTTCGAPTFPLARNLRLLALLQCGTNKAVLNVLGT